MRCKDVLPLSIAFLVNISISAKPSNRVIDLFGTSERIYSNEQGHPTFLGESALAVVSYRIVNLAPEVLTADYILIGDIINLNLFPDKEYRARIELIEVNSMGTITIRAKVADQKLGYFLISTTDNRSLAEISLPESNEYYLISSDPETLEHYLLEINRGELDVLVNAPAIPSPPLLEINKEEPTKSRSDMDSDRLTDPATVDVMIAFTTAARIWGDNNGGGIYNIIANAMNNGQLALENSDTLMNINLVFAGEVDYQESGSSAADLYRLATSPDFAPWGDYYNEHYLPGYLDEVHNWRDLYGADLVALFAQVSDVGGVGFLLQYSAGFPEIGFSLTRVQQAGFTFTYIHELGHNMGLHHHTEQTVQPGPTEWEDWPENTWSAGWRWIGNDGQRYCSVMTYESGAYFPDGLNHNRVAFFSNPQENHQGVATGDPVSGDNAQTLRVIRHVIAAYREPMVLASPVVMIDITDDQIQLSWQPIEFANSYKIYAVEDITIGDWGEPVAIIEELEYSEPLWNMRFYRVIASSEMIQ